jgi:hydrogenase maturation protease
MKSEGTALILGIGNEILTDDGIGIKLTYDLKSKFNKSSFDFKTASCGGLEIVEMMNGYKHVIIIDAIKTMYGKPGIVYHFTLDHFRQSMHVSNFHDISFLTAMEFGRKSGLKLPQQVDILAVEIIEDLVFSNELSPEIKEKY